MKGAFLVPVNSAKVSVVIEGETATLYYRIKWFAIRQTVKKKTHIVIHSHTMQLQRRPLLIQFYWLDRLGLDLHMGADLLQRRPLHNPLPPRFDVRVHVEDRRMRRRHDVEGKGEVVEVRKAEKVPGEVIALGQACLIDIEHLLELLQALVHDLLVRRGAEPCRVHDALVEDGRHGR
jgi:hypothetical protein